MVEYNKLNYNNKKTIKEINDRKNNDWFKGTEKCNCSFCISIRNKNK